MTEVHWLPPKVEDTLAVKIAIWKAAVVAYGIKKDLSKELFKAYDAARIASSEAHQTMLDAQGSMMTSLRESLGDEQMQKLSWGYD